jgi:serine/threonine protein kinase
MADLLGMVDSAPMTLEDFLEWNKAVNLKFGTLNAGQASAQKERQRSIQQYIELTPRYIKLCCFEQNLTARITGMIGSGMTANVFKASPLAGSAVPESLRIALKVFDESLPPVPDPLDCRKSIKVTEVADQELEILARLRHVPQVVNLYPQMATTPSFGVAPSTAPHDDRKTLSNPLVMEHLPGLDLEKFFEEKGWSKDQLYEKSDTAAPLLSPRDWAELRSLFHQLLICIETFSLTGFVNMDANPGNCFPCPLAPTHPFP